jgi:type IV pilus assembly protein PilA
VQRRYPHKLSAAMSFFVNLGTFRREPAERGGPKPMKTNVKCDQDSQEFRWPAKCNNNRRTSRKGQDSTVQEMRKLVRKQKGFSLIELLIVVAIILIIAAIAIPNLLRARIAANESSAASSLRTVNSAEVSYTTAYPTVGYSGTLSVLGNPGGATPCAPTSTNACLIDQSLAAATAVPGKSGFLVSQVGIADPNQATLNTTYQAGAAPITWNTSGVKAFCTTEDGVIRVDYGNTGKDVATVAHNACLAAPYQAMQ